MDYIVSQLEPFIGNEEIKNLTEVINNKWLTEGPFAKDFLNNIKEYTGSKYAVLANNGTLGLFIALKALGIKEGDEVIVPNFTFIASATSVIFAGAKPVLIDVDDDTLTMDVEKIEELITVKTKAIMPVHIYGQSADMDKIILIAAKYNLKIIEDAAQGFGVLYKGRHTGSMGDVGVISFFADKTITTGEGAVVLTNSDEIYEKLLFLRNQGRINSGTFLHPFLGMNFRMTDIQCAIGLAQIKKFEEIKRRKLEHYSYYRKLLSSVKDIEFISELSYCNYVPFRVNIKVKKLTELMQFLEFNKIQTRNFFYPLHRQPCLSFLNYNEESFPVSNKIYSYGLSLPVFPTLKKEQIEYICAKIYEFYKKNSYLY